MKKEVIKEFSEQIKTSQNIRIWQKNLSDFLVYSVLSQIDYFHCFI